MENQNSKSSELRGNNLDPLPGSEDKEFWGEAEINTGLTAKQVLDSTEHYFKRVSGHEAYCDHCSWGFALDPGDKIRDGHLFSREGRLVI